MSFIRAYIRTEGCLRLERVQLLHGIAGDYRSCLPSVGQRHQPLVWLYMPITLSKEYRVKKNV